MKSAALPAPTPRLVLLHATLTVALLGTAPGCGGIGVPRTIYLARHGQTEYNRISRLQGDPDLDPVGYVNRVSLWLLLKDRPLREIYTSERQRTRRTAELVARARELPIQARPELNEIEPGVFEGICWVELMPDIAAKYPGARECPVPARGSRPAVVLKAVRPLAAALRSESMTAKLPQGESYADLLARVEPFVEHLRRRARQSEILIVGHGVINRVLLHRLTGWTMAQVRQLRQENDQVLRIEDAGSAALRVSLYTPGIGWRRCSAPHPGQRQLDCSPPPVPRK